MSGRLAGRAPSMYWLALVLLAIAVLGSLVAGTLAGALGLFEDVSFWTAQRTGLGVALAPAMTVGMGIRVYARPRARLDETRERLRARELDLERAQRLATDARLASLDATSRHTSPLGEEVSVVPSHLEIERARLGDRLRATVASN